jgi:gliding motility-associated-like protein
MKKLFLHIVLCLLVTPVFSQGWVTKDAHLVLKDDAHVVIDGIRGNYTSKGDALITTTSSGTIHVDGDWINNGSTPAVGNNAGSVELTGANQQITGTTSTSFNNLTLSGGGIKTLDKETLVGGGYSGLRQGTLNLNDRHLLLNTQLLILNNTNAVSRTTGMLIGETDPIAGYSNVQYNIRDAATGSGYTVPFGTMDFNYIPFNITITNTGNQASDSGFISVASYPTNPIAIPNNRPLPTGVANMNNRYNIENDLKSVDRFFILNSAGYTTNPVVKFGFSYVDREWDGLTGGVNNLIEKDLKATRYDVTKGAWGYGTKGTTNASTNLTVTDNITKISGAWVLLNSPYCPVSNFNFTDACLSEPILFTDSSYIQEGYIDSTIWEYEQNKLYAQNNLLHKFSGSGLFDITRRARGNRGCWDSITKTVQLYPHPVGSFTYRDTCFDETTQFASNSTSTIGMPLNHRWVIDGNIYVTATPKYKFRNEGIKNIKLITKNTFGCLDTLNKELEIQPLPQVAFGFKNICEREEAFFFDSTKTKGTVDEWQWQVRDKIVSYLPDHNQVFNTAGIYPVQLNAMNNFGCADSLNQNITIWPKAKAKFDKFPKDIYITDPFVNFVESGSDANWWKWRFGDFSPEEFGPEVMHQYSDTGVFRVRLIADNDYKCSDTFYRTVIIKPNLNIFIPNAFSPGPDNDVNKTFGPVGMLYGIKTLDMTIYTRWGELIYHTEDIEQPWDGTYMGELVQEGTYLYLIKIKDVYNDVFRYSGTVSIIR